MKELKNKSWRDEDEMMEELEELGYDVVGINKEYVFVMDIDDRMSEFPTECALRLYRTSNKIKII